MFQQLVSHNDDIGRLVSKGYAVAYDASNVLVVRDIPYLNHDLNLQIGAIVTKFVDKGNDRIVQDDHQIFFAGSAPYGLDGKPIPNLGGGPAKLSLSEDSQDVKVQYSFSNKPVGARKFRDFFEKIESYVTIISGPAIELYQANPLTFRSAEESVSTSPFKVRDTLTSRAEICDLSEKFKDDVVAIIGLGGTGAYLLDLLVKTPVREIRAFDSDRFYVHNSFRSPGGFDHKEIGKTKAEIYQARYQSFRAGLSSSPKFIDATCSDDLKGITFAFVCVDRGSSRANIFELLIDMGIPFIDVGMGLDRNRGPLNGMLRTTYFSTEHGSKTRDMRLAELADTSDDLYRANIQIGELNALNACLAIIKYKQLRGFYYEEIPNFHLLFQLGDLKVNGIKESTEN